MTPEQKDLIDFMNGIVADANPIARHLYKSIPDEANVATVLVALCEIAAFYCAELGFSPERVGQMVKLLHDNVVRNRLRENRN